MADNDPAAARGPVAITVLTAPGCPHCARAVGLVRRLAAAAPQVAVTVLDVAAAPALVARFGLKSVPVIVVDDTVVLVGEVAPARLAAVVAAVGTPAFATERVRTLLEHRRLDAVVAYLGRGAAPAAIVPLLRAGDLSLRVAVLLALEEAAAQAPGCLAALVPDLLELLGSPDARLRGDVADVLGTIGDERARAPLTALRADPDATVADAAADALARLSGVGALTPGP